MILKFKTFKYNNKYNDVFITDYISSSGRKLYVIRRFVMDSLLEQRLEHNNKGEIVAINFFTKKLIKLLFKENISVEQSIEELKNLLDKVTKVPENRLEFTFHSLTSLSYPDIAKLILETCNFNKIKSIEAVYVLILKIIVEFWD